MKKILEVRGLTKIHGRGCELCLESTGPDMDTNICPHCGSVVACHNISLDLHEGEILGIMGESGSGKSTVVKTLFFDDEPTAGEALFFDGERQWDMFALNAAQQRWLAQPPLWHGVPEPASGTQFQRLGRRKHLPSALLMSDLAHYGEIRERARSLLARTEVLAERMDESPKKFSGGMQQRVQIAKALATQPPLLYLDEVTTGLDLSVQARILDLILEIQQELGTAMIVVTHDLGVIRLLTGRTIVMKYGRGHRSPG
uniref:HtxJ n=1 Tax=Stutzerimonas stutzeri TaxID=316 RepID=Q7BTH1_STUST|nr:HtxJ [Stutzerimonas stutzeri]